MQKQQFHIAPQPPDVRVYVNGGMLVGRVLGIIAAIVYTIWAGLFIVLIIDLMIPGIGWVLDILYVVALVVCAGIGSAAGALLGFLVYCYVYWVYKMSV